MSWIDTVSVIPYSTFFILLVNLGTVLASSLIFRLMVDIDRLEAQELEVRIYNKALKEVERRGDKAALRKLKRREIRIKQLSAASSRQRLKVIMVTILPFMTISLLLSSLYLNKEVAVFPFELPLLKEFSFSVWYLLSYFMAYLPLSRIFRTSPGLWQDSATLGTKEGG